MGRCQHGGQSLPILRGEVAEFSGELGQRVALVGPFAFVPLVRVAGAGGFRRCNASVHRDHANIVSVCVFAFAGANPGAN